MAKSLMFKVRVSTMSVVRLFLSDLFGNCCLKLDFSYVVKNRIIFTLLTS